MSSNSLQLNFEKAMIALLKEGGTLDGLEIAAASDRDATVPPLHAFVLCKNANPLLPGGPAFKPEIALTLVTNIDDHDNSIRSAWHSCIQQRIRDMADWFLQGGGEYRSENVGIRGLSLKETREISDGNQTGDVFDMVAGYVLGEASDTVNPLQDFEVEGEPVQSVRVIPQTDREESDVVIRRSEYQLFDYHWPWSWVHPKLHTDSDVVENKSYYPTYIAPVEGDSTRWISLHPSSEDDLPVIELGTAGKKVARKVVTGIGYNDTFIRYALGSVRKSASDAVDNRIAGKSAATAKAIFTTQNHAGSIYVRNPDCWAADIDLTALSPWNSTGANTMAGTLISPRHIIFATHFQIATGATIRFVTSDNQVVTRTMTGKQSLSGYSNYYPDLTVGVLNSDVPATIKFAKILPTNWQQKIPQLFNGNTYLVFRYFPALVLDQEEKALVADIFYITNSAGFYGAMVNFTNPTNAQRLAFSEQIIGGDSGNPAFLIINNELVLLTVWTFGAAGSGTSIVYHKDELNSIMTALGGGYQLTEIDLSAFRDFEPQ